MLFEGQEEVYAVGDRVLRHGLKNTAHFPPPNGRYAVNLDLLGPYISTRLPSSDEKLPSQLALPESKRAPVSNGYLDQAFASPMSFILDLIRFISAHYLMAVDDEKEMSDTKQMVMADNPRSLARLNHLLTGMVTLAGSR